MKPDKERYPVGTLVSDISYGIGMIVNTDGFYSRNFYNISFPKVNRIVGLDLAQGIKLGYTTIIK